MGSTTKLILGIAIFSMGIAGIISMYFTLQEIEQIESWLEDEKDLKKIIENSEQDTFEIDIEIDNHEDDIKDRQDRLQICPVFIVIFIVFGIFFLVKWRYERKLEIQNGSASIAGPAQPVPIQQPPQAQPNQYQQYPPSQPPQYPPAQPPQYPPNY